MTIEPLNPDLEAKKLRPRLSFGRRRASRAIARLHEQQSRMARLEHRLTELEQENAILLEAERSREAFLAVISHQLRTPLNTVMGFASILSDEVEGPLNSRQHEATAKVLHGADRLLLLINDLLETSKIQAGKFQLYPKPTTLAPLVQEVVRQVQPDARTRKVSLDLDVQVTVAPILDGQRIAQVMLHLLGNAIRHAPPGSAVSIRAFEQEDHLLVEVEDHGPGIRPEEIPRLFTRTKPRTGDGRPSGLGLGLPLCRSIIKAHGGTLGARSTPGEGSTFWFSLPLTSAVPVDALPSASRS